MSMTDDLHAEARIARSGAPLGEAKAAIVFLHGRGATAPSILELAPHIGAEGMAYLAPQAVGNTWYPYSFLQPLDQNEPWLSSALRCVGRVIELAVGSGIAQEKIALVGFSQGGCLALEYAVRDPRAYPGVVGLSSGLIGPPGTKWNSEGSLAGSHAFLGCSDVDLHIPVERVHESAKVLRDLGAEVTERIYPGMGHTINPDEIVLVRQLMSRLVQ